jgi:KaiC/GvpD/RAD55 family RecA-like ATPase/ribosomal protein L37AE/L43A
MITDTLTQYGITFKEQSGQIVVDCPECGKEKHCYIDEAKRVWFCQKCERSGTFEKYLSDVTGIAFTKAAEQKPKGSPPTEDYIETCHKRLWGQRGQKAYEYLEGRKITRDAMEYFRLGCEEKDGELWITIPYIENEKPVNIKYRIARDTKEKEDKWRRWPEGKSILFNQNCLDSIDKTTPVFIAEAEFDCMALWSQGYKAVSSTIGAKDFRPEWVDQLERFTRPILVFDSDRKGQEAARKIAARLGLDRTINVKFPTKDANEFFISGKTREDFDKLISSSEAFEIDNIMTLDRAFMALGLAMERKASDSITSQWPSLARLAGSYEPGDMIILTAPPKIGKTTFALNETLWLAKHGRSVFFYCIEMRPERITKKLFQIHNQFTEEQLTIPAIITAYKQLEGIKFCIGYNRKQIGIDGVIETIRLGTRRFGFQFVVFDNLHFLVRAASNQTQEIGIASQKFKMLAEELQIPIMVIAQPKRFEEDRVAGINDLKDSSAIGADADTVIALYREKTKGKAASESSFSEETIVRVDASRFTSGGQTLMTYHGDRGYFEELKREV